MDITTRHRLALEDWTYAEHLSQCIPMAQRPVVRRVALFLSRIPILGSAIRTLQRVRYLGASSQRQLILNQIAFEEEQFHGSFMTDTSGVLATLQREIAEMLARQGALEENLLSLHEALLQSEARHNTLEAQLSMASAKMQAELARVTDDQTSNIQESAATLGQAVQQVALESAESVAKLGQAVQQVALESAESAKLGHTVQQVALQSADSVAKLGQAVQAIAAQSAVTASGLATVEDSARMHSSHIRLLRQDIEGPAQVAGADAPDGAGQIPALIGLLESEMPELHGCGDVGLSIYGSGLDHVLFALFAYFGERLATTEDAIVATAIHYHIDFSPSWNCPQVFEGAARKLIPGGYFVVVTSEAGQPAPERDRFSLVVDRLLTVEPGTVRVLVWRNEKPSSQQYTNGRAERAGVA